MAILLYLVLACDSPVASATVPASASGPDMSPPAATPAATDVIQGTVKENLLAGNYVYTRVATADGKEIWAAAPGTPPAVGTAVTVPTVLPMENFHSEALKRDFAVVYFAESITSTQASAMPRDGKMPDWHPKVENPEDCGPLKPDAPATIEAALAQAAASSGAPVEKVERIWTDRDALNGKKISVSGQVVKVTTGVLGKNWLHIRDGSGAEGTNDLTVTTSGGASVGDKVVVTGTVMTNQDFGYGYTYTVLLADAAVTAAVAGS